MKKVLNLLSVKEWALAICASTCILFVGILTTKVAERIDYLNNVTNFFIEKECDFDVQSWEFVDIDDEKIMVHIYSDDEIKGIYTFDIGYYGNWMVEECKDG